MELSKKIRMYDGNDVVVSFEQVDTCPLCNGRIEPKYIDGHLDKSNYLSVFNFCRLCMCSFISRYSVSNIGNIHNHSYFVESVPSYFEERKFEEIIVGLSKRFKNVYNQAKQAEEMGLDEIAGMAYRKSLEILIKDYAIALNPEEASSISSPKFTLDQCITKYVKNEKLQNVSKLTTWLGNDETHYTRIHVDKDINDLKEYLEATIYFVIFDLTADKAFSIIKNK